MKMCYYLIASHLKERIITRESCTLASFDNEDKLGSVKHQKQKQKAKEEKEKHQTELWALCVCFL